MCVFGAHVSSLTMSVVPAELSELLGMAFAPHLCAQTGASRAFRACVGQADAQGASCQAATRPLSLESLWSEQKVKGLESLWSEKKELKVKCGWPAAGLRQSNICGWPAAGLRQSNMLEKLHKTQSPRRFQHTLYCTRTHTHTAPHTHPASPKQAAAYTHRIQIQYGRQGNTDRQGIGKVEGILVFIGTSSVTAAKRMSFFHNSFQVRGPYRRHTDRQGRQIGNAC